LDDRAAFPCGSRLGYDREGASRKLLRHLEAADKAPAGIAKVQIAASRSVFFEMDVKQ
jgi:hypothetical protein